MHGDMTYFNVNRHINPTNVCVAACSLCAFGRKKDDPARYTMALEEAWETAATGYTEAVTEFHIVGGLHPDLPFEYFLDLVRGLKQRFPQGAHQGLHHGGGRLSGAARQDFDSLRRLLKLNDAGVDSMPGGGAEIFADRVRHIICDHKIDGGEWLETARAAHKLGLQVERHHALRPCGERRRPRGSPAEAARAAGRDRRLPDLYPAGLSSRTTRRSQHLPETTGMTDMRQIAVGRLLLDNFAHIKAYWQMMTPKIAQIALRFGADDIDGTVVEEKIYHDAGATTPQGMRRKDLIRLITRSGPRARSSATRSIAR